MDSRFEAIVNEKDEKNLPSYYTQDRLEWMAHLDAKIDSLNQQTFLFDLLDASYMQTERSSPSGETQRQRDQLRTLTAQMIKEVAGVLEGLAAASLDPDDPPTKRVERMMTYRTGAIHDFYQDTIDDLTVDDMRSIFCYPEASDLNIDPSDCDIYQEGIEGEMKAYLEFYKLAKRTRDMMKGPRNDITHGFRVVLDRGERPGENSEDLPNGCEDWVNTVDFRGGPEGTSLLTGERPHEIYATIMGNAALAQKTILAGLKLQLLNEGEPVYQDLRFSHATVPNKYPDSRPVYDVHAVDANLQLKQEQGTIEKQEQLYADIDDHVEKYTPEGAGASLVDEYSNVWPDSR